MKQFSLPAALLLGSSVAVADTGTTLSPVVVTATRTAQTADETLASVTVITREDIERKQVQSVPDLLTTVPGLSISNNGGPGKVTTVFLRGTNSDHVLVLIDGIKVSASTSGLAAFQDMPVSQIERIEIVRGPRSSLYGSEAIGGVIQIFTKRGQPGLAPTLRVGVGSHSSHEVDLGLSGGNDHGSFNFSLGEYRTDGIDATVGGQTDRDGYERRSGSLSGRLYLTDRTDLDLLLSRADSENEFDGFENLIGTIEDYEESERTAAGATLTTQATDRVRYTLTLARYFDYSDVFNQQRVQTSQFDTRRTNVSAQADLELSGNTQLKFGIDHQREKIDVFFEDFLGVDQEFDITERENDGLFTQLLTSVGGGQFEASLRHDDNDQFGGHTTGSLAYGYHLNDGLRFVTSYGTAFKAPSFNELAYPGFGNPDLKPEESENVDLGLAGRHAYGNWSLTLFQNDIDNLIAGFPAVNIASARIRGIEAIYSATYRDWLLNSSLVFNDPEDRDANTQLLRRAKRVFNVELDRSFGAYSFGASLHAESQRPDWSTRLPGYGVVDLRASYRLTPAWKLQARLANLFDKDYQTAAGFNQDGRNFFVTLGYQPR